MIPLPDLLPAHRPLRRVGPLRGAAALTLLAVTAALMLAGGDPGRPSPAPTAGKVASADPSVPAAASASPTDATTGRAGRGPRAPGVGPLLATVAMELPIASADAVDDAATAPAIDDDGLVRLRAHPRVAGTVRVEVTARSPSIDAVRAIARVTALAEALGARTAEVDDLEVSADGVLLTASVAVAVADHPVPRRRPRPRPRTLAETTAVLARSARTDRIGDLRIQRLGDDGIVLTFRSADAVTVASWLAGVERSLAGDAVVDELDVESVDDGVRVRVEFRVHLAPESGAA